MILNMEVANMYRRLTQLSIVALFTLGLLALTQSSSAQTTPAPTALNRPDYNYTEANGCTRCHFTMNPDGTRRGPHMIEAVGVNWDDTNKVFKFTGNGWFASQHANSNYKSTQNTYCAKCHSPLQAKPEATFKKGILINTEQIPDGQMEGVTCAVCHPSHNAAVVLGRRLGLYKYGMDKSKPEAYNVIHHGEEDQLCLSCHIERHDEDVPAMAVMYEVGVKCIDCHMAPYAPIEANPALNKVFHDFKVAKNLPFSCGVQGSVIHCHPGYTTEGTLAFLPYMKQTHKNWWPLKPGKLKKSHAAATAADYKALWDEMEAQVKANQ
jgi:hypothetical protein